ncbi:hypothetical protein HAZT_HAZT010846 [Hyalella azteca]|uniref:limulus clotting factor C n=1 Tax=Hyalella azteca TaxID=294128 RepID=A0A6A0HED8_HYAAZ|nr:hypothetical protein HAZT_HAZT010846 [Hyalella azteca]
MFKAVVVAVICCTAYAAGNPAAGVEWRWTPRHLTVSPNVHAVPYKQVIDSYVPRVYTPGTRQGGVCKIKLFAIIRAKILPPVEGCGPVPAQDRIVGGEEAVPHSYPWMVALFIDDIYFCGGSIIDDQWILTAAHCMDGARSVDVVAGAHNIRQNEPSQVTLTSTDFTVHEDWGSILIRNDVAIIHLPEKLTWSAEIAPVCLPAASAPELQAGVLVNPSGWGRPSDAQSSISDVLRQVVVPVESNEVCGTYYGASVTPDVICIDSTGGKGTCNGDSGGPLNYVDGGKTYTRGIVSYGSSTGCETGYPDAFTRVTHYLDWISEKTGIAIDA